MRKTILATALLSAASLAPAHAGFFLEGIRPFSTSYCEGAKPSTHDPMIKAPAEAWKKTSPRASTMNGRPTWDALNCPDGKVAPVQKGKIHMMKKTPIEDVVPQK